MKWQGGQNDFELVYKKYPIYKQHVSSKKYLFLNPDVADENLRNYYIYNSYCSEWKKSISMKMYKMYWKQPKCPSANEWIKKLWYIYTMEFHAAERKKELIPFTTAWMELESIMLSEISRAVRDKYYMISPLTGT